MQNDLPPTAFVAEHFYYTSTVCAAVANALTFYTEKKKLKRNKASQVVEGNCTRTGQCELAEYNQTTLCDKDKLTEWRGTVEHIE